MIKYVIIPQQKKTIAILDGCSGDAFEAFCKRINMATHAAQNAEHKDFPFALHPFYGTIRMPSKIKAEVICRDGDEYDINVGKQKAKEKLMQKYYAALDKRIDKMKREFSTYLNYMLEVCR